MSWLYKTDEERKDEISNIAKEETGITNFNENGTMLGFINTIVKIINFLYSGLIELLVQTNYSTASGNFLDLWGMLIGVTRSSGRKTQIIFLGSSYASGKISAGTWFVVEGTVLRFKVLSDISFEENQINFQIPCESEFEGIKYNLTSSNLTIRSTKVVDGLDKIIIPQNNYIAIAGLDDEKDESLRQKIKAKWNSFSEQFPKSKYIYIAKSVLGVQDVKVIRTPRGAGTTDVVISTVVGENTNFIVNNVKNTIIDRGAICRDLLVWVASKKDVLITISFIGDCTSAEIQNKIDAMNNSFLIGEKFVIAKIYHALYSSFSFQSLVISPSNDIEISDYSTCFIKPTITKVGI